MEKDFSWKAKLLMNQSTFMLTPTNGNKFWVSLLGKMIVLLSIIGSRLDVLLETRNVLLILSVVLESPSLAFIDNPNVVWCTLLDEVSL